MKELRITLTDEEHQALLRMKGAKSWHDWLVSMLPGPNKAPSSNTNVAVAVIDTSPKNLVESRQS